MWKVDSNTSTLVGVRGNPSTQVGPNGFKAKHASRVSSETPQEEQTFELEILQCIENALSNFGENVPSTVLGNLRWIGGISKEEITSSPDIFDRSLDIIFRQASSRVRQAILEEIKSKFGLSECASNLREAFAEANSHF